jgi:hypothetical protein
MAKRSTKSSVKHRPTIRQRTVKYKAKADPSAIQNSSAIFTVDLGKVDGRQLATRISRPHLSNSMSQCLQ